MKDMTNINEFTENNKMMKLSNYVSKIHNKKNKTTTQLHRRHLLNVYYLSSSHQNNVTLGANEDK